MEMSMQRKWLATMLAAAMAAALVGCQREDAASGESAKSSSGAMMSRGTATAPAEQGANVAGARDSGPASSPQGAMGAAPPSPPATSSDPLAGSSAGKPPGDENAQKQKGAS